jgi:hypothetical protein
LHPFRKIFGSIHSGFGDVFSARRMCRMGAVPDGSKIYEVLFYTLGRVRNGIGKGWGVKQANPNVA